MKLYFRYGCVGSAKTLNLLSVAHNYELQNKKVLVLKPEIDTRFDTQFGEKIIYSRAGLSRKADIIIKTKDDIPTSFNGISCIIVDEVQFLNEEIIDRLREITNEIPVICYGLRTDFKSRLFNGSKRLLEIADSIEEIKTTCFYCNKKAILNIKHVNGKKIKEGDQIELGTEETYLPVCYTHY